MTVVTPPPQRLYCFSPRFLLALLLARLPLLTTMIFFEGMVKYTVIFNSHFLCVRCYCWLCSDTTESPC